MQSFQREGDALKVQLEIPKLKISLRYSVMRQLGGNGCASQLCLSKLGDLEQVTLPLCVSIPSLYKGGGKTLPFLFCVSLM